jgi:hypothetical protein
MTTVSKKRKRIKYEIKAIATMDDKREKCERKIGVFLSK